MREGTPDFYPVLILGGGLAGLSTAYHLPPNTFAVLEREGVPGGTARSFRFKNFTFDITGHLLHLHNPYTKKLVTELLRNQFFVCARNTWIYSKNVYTPYPFQANTHGLPDSVVNDCLLGFFDSYLRNKTNPPDFSALNFHDWCHSVFGFGIARHFMIPYNEKLFQTRSTDMTVEWCGRFVPRPKLEDVVKGAVEPHTKKFGYNPTFLYPKKGGIQILSQAMAARLKGTVALKTPVRTVYWKEKKVKTETGKIYSYRYLINTIPLAEILKKLTPPPPAIRAARRRLKSVGILCLNMGVKRANISDKSWVYFPENEFLFYRVGFPMNFTPHVVPKGHSSMYVEIPMRRVKNRSRKSILLETRKGLERAGILKKSDRIPVVQFLPVRYAYVVYDRNRNKALRTINRFLNKNQIQSIGRYGAWKYSFMEEAILDGREAAEKIKDKVRFE